MLLPHQLSYLTRISPIDFASSHFHPFKMDMNVSKSTTITNLTLEMSVSQVRALDFNLPSFLVQSTCRAKQPYFKPRTRCQFAIPTSNQFNGLSEVDPIEAKCQDILMVKALNVGEIVGACGSVGSVSNEVGPGIPCTGSIALIKIPFVVGKDQLVAKQINFRDLEYRSDSVQKANDAHSTISSKFQHLYGVMASLCELGNHAAKLVPATESVQVTVSRDKEQIHLSFASNLTQSGINHAFSKVMVSPRRQDSFLELQDLQDCLDYFDKSNDDMLTFQNAVKLELQGISLDTLSALDLSLVRLLWIILFWNTDSSITCDTPISPSIVVDRVIYRAPKSWTKKKSSKYLQEIVDALAPPLLTLPSQPDTMGTSSIDTPGISYPSYLKALVEILNQASNEDVEMSQDDDTVPGPFTGMAVQDNQLSLKALGKRPIEGSILDIEMTLPSAAVDPNDPGQTSDQDETIDNSHGKKKKKKEPIKSFWRMDLFTESTDSTDK